MRIAGAFPLLALLMACTGSAGPVGPVGDTERGEPGELGDAGLPQNAVVTSIAPNEVYLGREVDVVISGSGTDWASLDDIEVDFGDGVEIVDGSLNLASPTALTATIRIDTSAPLGLRNVSVHSGASVALFENTFNVDEPVSVGSFLNGGVTAQGSVLFISLFANDPTVTFTQAQAFDIPETLNVRAPSGSARLPDRFGFLGGLVEPRYAEYALLLDVHTEIGLTDVVVENGPSGFADISTSPGAINVAKRTPKQLPVGQTTRTINTFSESLLYVVQADAGTNVRISTLTTGMTPPQLWLLPASGRWDEVVGAGPDISFFSPEAATFYVVYYQPSNELFYDVTLDRSDVQATLTQIDPLVPHVDSVSPPIGNYYPITATKGQTLTATISDGITHSCFGFPEILAFLLLHGPDGNEIIGEVGFPPCPTINVLIPEDGTYYLRVDFDSFAPTQSFDYTLTYDLQ